MNRFFTSRFWIIVVISACANICFATEEVDSNWFSYLDGFQTISKVESESCYHSIIWPENAFPPEDEPYLYLYESGGCLGFGGSFTSLQEAELVYRFPFADESYVGPVEGTMKISVLLPYETSASLQRLQYFVSPDGINWSNAKKLPAGINNISISSIRGVCYIKLKGLGALVEYIEVVLNKSEPDYFVKNGSSELPYFSKIQDAINHAKDGDIIEVAPGTYEGSGNCNIDFQGKSITIYSEKGPEETIIDCKNNSRGFYFHQNEDANSVLRGFKIKNGKVSNYGAGIYCEFTSPGIVDCVITNCSAKFGGGIGVISGSPYIADCLIQDCKTDQSDGHGAGIALLDSESKVVNTKILNNTGHDNSFGIGLYCVQSKVALNNCDIRMNGPESGNVTGGGIYAGGLSTDIQLQNCLIADNTAQFGAGIYTDSIENITGINPDSICNVFINNCTIANNKISGEKNDIIGGGIHSLSCNIEVSNSIIWGNDSNNIHIDNSDLIDSYISFSDFPGGDEIGDDNIDVDPCFVSTSTLILENRDYHLKSKAENGYYDSVQEKWIKDSNHSLCIDAGNPDDNIGPEPSPNGKRINMGAYGGTEQASKNTLTPLILHVSTSGNNNNSGLSKQYAFRTIERAVEKAQNGDVIMIWPGTYYEEVSFNNKAITIQSADEPAVVIANQGGYAFRFYSESPQSVLRNLIIKNCSGTFGGAIYCDFASPTLSNLTIVNNSAGIYTLNGSSPKVKNCIFWGNNYDYEVTDPDILNTISYCRLEVIADRLLYKSTCISYDPRFVDYDSDFQLKSNSKCIDAGDGDFSRELQPNGNRINMGAYGGTPLAARSNQ